MHHIMSTPLYQPCSSPVCVSGVMFSHLSKWAWRRHDGAPAPGLSSSRLLHLDVWAGYALYLGKNTILPFDCSHSAAQLLLHGTTKNAHNKRNDHFIPLMIFSSQDSFPNRRMAYKE